MVNYYTFAEEIPSIGDQIKSKCRRGIEILAVRKCGNFAPHVYRVAVEFRVSS
ncbi:MAG: hypothetical protein KKI07_00910 [Euryarchaeota archaeon]|nr:hypothetical protein [Euryarchaeota archaeon]